MELWKLFDYQIEITSICHEESMVFVGSAKSDVTKYQLLKRKLKKRPKELIDQPWHLQKLAHLNLGSKRRIFRSGKIQKILSDAVRELVFIQYNNSLYVYSYDLKQQKYYIRESKGMTTFVMDESASGNRSFHRCTILMSVENKFYFVHYTPSAYTITKEEELLLPEKVEQFRWYKNTLLVGFPRGRKYCKIDLADQNSGSEEIIECDDPYLVMMHHEILLRLNDTIVILNLLRSGDDEDDDVGMMNRSTIHFLNTPSEIGTMFPYIVGLVRDKIEIRNLYDRNDIATKQFQKGSKLFTTSNTKTMGIFLTDKKSLYILSPIPYSIQIKELLKKCRCQEAFEMFEKTFEGTEEEREEERIILCIKAGFNSIFHGEVDQSFKYFREVILEFDIREVLYFFNISWRGEANKKEILPFQRKYNKKIDKNLKSILQNRLLKLQKERVIRKMKREELEMKIEEKYMLSKEELLNFLKEKSLLLQKTNIERIICDNTIVKLLLELNQEDLVVFLRNKDNCVSLEMKKLLQPFDNGFFSVLLYRSKGLVIETLKEIEKITGSGYLDEYFEKKFTKEAISILLEMDDTRFESITFHHLEWIFGLGLKKYKQKLMNKKEERKNSSQDQFDIIRIKRGGGGGTKSSSTKSSTSLLDYEWFFEEGLTVLTKRRKVPLKPERVIAFFRNILDKHVTLHSTYLLKFLEYVISQNEDKTKLYHNEICKLYIELITKELEKYPGLELRSPGNEPGKIGGYRLNLLQHLETSENYNYEDILRRLLETKLYHEQCNVYKKLNEHEKALRILVINLRQPISAEKYCAEELSDAREISSTKFIQHHKKLKSDRFIALLKICFEKKELMISNVGIISRRNKHDLVKFAIKILNTYPNFIDVEEAIKIIPDSISIRRIRPFLERGSQQQYVYRNYNQIQRNLWKTHYYSVKMKIIKLQSRGFVHDSKLKCARCGKNITTSAICVYPNFCIVHYSCRTRGTENSPFIEPITNRNFKTHPISIDGGVSSRGKNFK